MLTIPLHTGDPIIDAYSLRVLTTGSVITQITFINREHESETNPHDPFVALITQALSAWYDGDVSKLRALPLAPAATPWASKIRTVLHRLPLGKTLSYTQLAQLANNPRAVRAAASACARNPFPLVIPCHAVVPQPTQHKLERNPELVTTAHFPSGNYAFGPDLKRALLKFDHQHSHQFR
ncbi:methylated-DNA--[protein]-cysteine S-methyltransferase [Arcanobacterium phocisimile]|uniref:Methylated-DNA--[protein]-cysteine S-methyltransferase n=1 Tax=Arcanobacterium phocisimile TaxID=1302235 RepID=A0ABX7IHC5_9ACTO|nr:methylated-DNA--[protein]-cysteine S-methyltransferase [Arcanobacterium phocisimile]QRV02531.1 methylated-DNA--[protein]-cysteine S-methyltransferase [Arcanobacterium phocisimile]